MDEDYRQGSSVGTIGHRYPEGRYPAVSSSKCDSRPGCECCCMYGRRSNQKLYGEPVQGCL